MDPVQWEYIYIHLLTLKTNASFVGLCLFSQGKTPHQQRHLRTSKKNTRDSAKTEKMTLVQHPYHPCMIYIYLHLPSFSIYHKNQPNVGKYTIHGWYGTDFCLVHYPWDPYQWYIHIYLHIFAIIFKQKSLKINNRLMGPSWVLGPVVFSYSNPTCPSLESPIPMPTPQRQRRP